MVYLVCLLWSYSKNSKFQNKHIPTWAHSILGTFQQSAHSIMRTFQKGTLRYEWGHSKRAHSKKARSTFWTSPFAPADFWAFSTMYLRMLRPRALHPQIQIPNARMACALCYGYENTSCAWFHSWIHVFH